jgi:uncharacterized protein
VEPDIAIFSVSAQGNASTSVQALSNLNNRINTVNLLLQSYRIPAANRTTSSIDLQPQYNYDNGASILVGQQASASLEVTVGNLSNNTELLGRIVKSLANTTGISMSGFTFRNSNTAAAERLARVAAVRNAQSKATQYAALSNRALGSLVKVVDQNRGSYTPYVMDGAYFSFQSQVLSIPYGKVKVEAYVQIDWII